MSLEEISGELKIKPISQENKKIGLIDFDMQFIDFQHYLYL